MNIFTETEGQENGLQGIHGEKKIWNLKGESEERFCKLPTFIISLAVKREWVISDLHPSNAKRLNTDVKITEIGEIWVE